MKNILKRTLTIVFAVAILTGFVPWGAMNFAVTASAEELAITGQCGKNAFWTFDQFTGLLTISGSGDMYDYDYDLLNSPFYRNDLITTIVIENGITSICDYAFEYCTNLKSVIIPDSVTIIGIEAFNNCKSLLNITITNKISCIDYAFFHCDNIKQLKYNIENCESGTCAFAYSGIETVTISSSVKSIPDKLFAECPNLKNIIFESDGYIEMGNDVFLNSYDAVICCKENSYMHFYAETMGLKYCILDDSNNPSFTVKNDILTKYNGSAENVFISSASQIGFGAFSGNENVKSVELASNVIRIFSQAFKNCTNLENVIIQKNVSSIGDDAFEGCNNLVIWCYADSYAESYALSHYIPVKYITLELSQPVVTLETNDTAILCASFSTALTEENQLKWISDNPNVVTVTEDGKITAIGVGEATLTAISSNGLSANCLVKVTKTDTPEQKGKVKSVSVNNISLDYKAKGKLNPIIDVDSGVKYKVEYKSSNTNIATVDNNGNVYAAKKGNATVTCTVTDEYGNQVSDTCNVTVGYTWWQWIIKIVLFGWIWY